MNKTMPDSRLNALKLLAAFGVIVVHVSMARVLNVDIHSLDWWVAALSDAAGRIGSATFAMVAGAVLLARPSENDPWCFIKQRVGRLFPALIFWSCFYFAWRARMGEEINPRTIFRDVVQGSPMYHLWFMYMMLGMYFIMPGLRYCILGVGERATSKYLILIAALLTWIASMAQTLQEVAHSSFLGLVPFFVVYVFAGYYFSRKIINISTKVLMLIALLCVLLMGLGIALTYPYMKDWSFILFYSNRSPFAMLLTFCVFLVFMRCSQDFFPFWINKLGVATLGVYAIHPFWMGVLSMAGWEMTSTSNDWLVHSIVVFSLSMASSCALCSVPYLRRLAS